MGKSFNVLSLDGGGVKGIYSIGFLKELELIINKKLYEVFDLIYGTSTGAIIAILISLGKNMSYIENLYLKLIPKIMNKKNNFNKSLILEKLFSDEFKNLKMNSCKIPTGIISTNYDKNMPIVFKSHKFQSQNGQHSFIPGFGKYLKEIVLSSCSAYPFFKPVNLKINNINTTLIDGGYCFNNPALMALADAKKITNKNQQIKVLSVGTGSFLEKKNIIEKFLNIFFITKLFTNTVLEVNSNSVNDLINHLNMENIHYFRINDTFNDIKTNLLEKDVDVLYKIKDKGKKSFIIRENEIKKIFNII